MNSGEMSAAYCSARNPLDLAHGHAARVHGHDLVVEALETPLMLFDNLGFELGLPIAGNLDLDLAKFAF